MTARQQEAKVYKGANLIQVKRCKNAGALKRLLNLLATDEHITRVEWQVGLSGYTVVYHVDEPGYNVRGGKPETHADELADILQESTPGN